MKNITQIASLLITFFAGSITILSTLSAYRLFCTYQKTGVYYDPDFDDVDISSLIKNAAFFLCVSLIAAFTFWCLYTEKTRNEGNPTILDYDNATSNPNNEQANQ